MNNVASPLSCLYLIGRIRKKFFKSTQSTFSSKEHLILQLWWQNETITSWKEKWNTISTPPKHTGTKMNSFHSNYPQNLSCSALLISPLPPISSITYKQPPHSASIFPQLLPNNSQAVTDCQHCVWGLEKYSCGTVQCVSTAFSKTQCHS